MDRWYASWLVPTCERNSHLLLMTQRTRLKQSLPHISVALPGSTSDPPDGFFAQPIEKGVHSWNPSFICHGQSCGAL